MEKRGYIPSKSELKIMSDSIVHLARDLDKLSLVRDVLVKSVHK